MGQCKTSGTQLSVIPAGLSHHLHNSVSSVTCNCQWKAMISSSYSGLAIELSVEPQQPAYSAVRTASKCPEGICVCRYKGLCVGNHNGSVKFDMAHLRSMVSQTSCFAE